MVYKVELRASQFCCLNCGYKAQLSDYWVSQVRKFKCPICTSPSHWRKQYLCTKEQLNNDTWKKLLITSNPLKFSQGKWKLVKHWKEFFNYMAELKERNPALYNKLLGEFPFADKVEELL